MSHALSDTTVTIGERVFNLPSPPGFIEVGDHPRYGKTLFESFTPVEVNLLHGYVSERDEERISQGDNPHLRRYMMSQVLSEIAEFDLSEADFEFVVASMKEEYAKEIETVDPQLKAAISESEKKASTLFELDVGIELGRMIPLESPIYTERSVTHVYVVPVEIEIEGNPSTHMMVLGSNIVLIQGKAIYLNVYSNFADANDVSWVREMSQKWLTKVIGSAE